MSHSSKTLIVITYALSHSSRSASINKVGPLDVDCDDSLDCQETLCIFLNVKIHFGLFLGDCENKQIWTILFSGFVTWVFQIWSVHHISFCIEKDDKYLRLLFTWDMPCVILKGENYNRNFSHKTEIHPLKDNCLTVRKSSPNRKYKL